MIILSLIFPTATPYFIFRHIMTVDKNSLIARPSSPNKLPVTCPRSLGTHAYCKRLLIYFPSLAFIRDF